MNVTLIAPPWYYKNPWIPSVEGLSQNLGLGYLAAYLIQHSHKVTVIDGLTDGIDNIVQAQTKYEKPYRIGLDYEEILDRIPNNTDLVGITVPFTNNAQIVHEISQLIKKRHPSISIVQGGVYPSTLPYKALTDSVDFVVRGEGETPILQLLSGIDPMKIKGLVFRKEGKIVDNGRAEQIKDLDSIPFPARELFPMERYMTWSPRGTVSKRTVCVITSRGCPYDCTFCSIHPMYGYQWRVRSPENVIEEIRYLVDRYKVEHIEFEDDNLTLHKKRAAEIFDRLIDLNLGITWSAHNGVRIDTLERWLLEKIKASGCTELSLPIESGDPEVLKDMQKKLELEETIQVLKDCQELGIQTVGMLIVGYPNETQESFQRTLAFLKECKKYGLKTCAPFIVKAYPATALYNYCKEKGWLDPRIDDHLFFSDATDDYVSVITPHFTREDVIKRRDMVLKMFDPVAYYMARMSGLKRIIKKYVPERVLVTAKYLTNRGLSKVVTPRCA